MMSDWLMNYSLGEMLWNRLEVRLLRRAGSVVALNI